MTGAGMMDCRKALTETNGDFEAAIDWLRKQGQKVAAKRSDREAFILHAVEDFTQEEIAAITNHTLEEVRASIRKSRQHLQRALPIKDLFKDKLAAYTQTT